MKRVRGNRKAFQEFVDALDVADARTARACASASRTPTRRSGRPSSRRWCATCGRRRRSRSETMLGAVIGAHAGPGTVGFFWFTRRT